MYRCYHCEAVAPPGTTANFRVLEQRTVKYRPGPEEQKARYKRKTTQQYCSGGEGTEIVTEVILCPECARRFDLETSTDTLEDDEVAACA